MYTQGHIIERSDRTCWSLDTLRLLARL